MVILKFRFNVLTLLSVVASLIQPAWSMEKRENLSTSKGPPTKKFKPSGETEPRDPIDQYNAVIDCLGHDTFLDPRQAIKTCMAAAEAKHLEAKRLVESMGKVIPESKKVANELLAKGLYNLTQTNTEILQDPIRLDKIAQTAARLGHAQAQYDLAERYRTLDIRTSVYWYKKAKKQEHKMAAFRLAEYCVEGNSDEKGEIIPQNLSKALKLFSEAAKDPSNKAKFVVSMLGPFPEEEQVRLAQGLFRLANREYTGEDIDQSSTDARFHYELAAKLGHEQAKVNFYEFFTFQRNSASLVPDQPASHPIDSVHSSPPSAQFLLSTVNPDSGERFPERDYFSRELYPVRTQEQSQDVIYGMKRVDSPVLQGPILPPLDVMESSSDNQNSWNFSLSDTLQQTQPIIIPHREFLGNLHRLITEASQQAANENSWLNYNLLLLDYYDVAPAFGDTDAEKRKADLLASRPNLEGRPRQHNQDLANCWYNLALDAECRRKENSLPLALKLYHLADQYGSHEAIDQVDRLNKLIKNQVLSNIRAQSTYTE